MLSRTGKSTTNQYLAFSKKTVGEVKTRKKDDEAPPKPIGMFGKEERVTKEEL